jgi:hypothetical protein
MTQVIEVGAIITLWDISMQSIDGHLTNEWKILINVGGQADITAFQECTDKNNSRHSAERHAETHEKLMNIHILIHTETHTLVGNRQLSKQQYYSHC